MGSAGGPVAPSVSAEDTSFVHRTAVIVIIGSSLGSNEARISSLVDDRRSSPSTRGCTGRCPTLPRPSLSSGRRGGLVYCPHFLKIILRRSPSRGRSALSALRLGRAPPRYRVPGYYGAHVLTTRININISFAILMFCAVLKVRIEFRSVIETEACYSWS